MKRFFLLLSLAGVLALCGGVAFMVIRDGRPKYPDVAGGMEVPQFSMIEIDFTHNYVQSRGLPFTAGAIIDVDNDGRDELFLGGGLRQADGLFVLTEDGFVDVADQVGLVKQGDGITLGAAVIDIDGNGYQDLIVSRENGLRLYRNHGGTFTMEKLDIPIPPGSVPLGVAVGDLNNDGHIDFFLPLVRKIAPFTWLYGEEEDSAVRPRLYLNNGDDTFFDSTAAVGLQSMEESFQALFADLDDDGLMDLVTLHTNGFITTWKNLGELLFANKAHFQVNRRGDYMGLAAGDYDGDGRIDLFLSNRGGTIPQSLLQALQSRKAPWESHWTLMNNSGFFSFRSDEARSRIAEYEMGRGALFADINSDGRMDLLVSQNHPYWPLYLVDMFRLPGRVLLQNDEGQFFEAAEDTGIINRGYGVTPLEADFNGDGRPDIAHINLGGKSRVFLNTPGQNHYLRVKLPDSARSLGANVEVKTVSGAILKRQFLVGRGLCSDSSHNLFFGLGQDKAIDVMVKYRNGETDQTSGVLFDTTIVFD
jgi:enediyne biosynthesis protein E4